MFQEILNHLRLLPLSAPASPASARGRAGSCAVCRAGCDVDLSLLDLTASLWREVLNLLLSLQIKHHVSQLLLQLCYCPVLTFTYKIRYNFIYKEENCCAAVAMGRAPEKLKHMFANRLWQRPNKRQQKLKNKMSEKLKIHMEIPSKEDHLKILCLDIV